MQEPRAPQTDPIQAAIDESRQMLKLGVDRFSFPAAIVRVLIGDVDHLSEIHRFNVEYGVNALLNHLSDDGARERLLVELLGARPDALGIYELPRLDHTGCFWRDGDGWSWFIRFADGTCR